LTFLTFWPRRRKHCVHSDHQQILARLPDIISKKSEDISLRGSFLASPVVKHQGCAQTILCHALELLDSQVRDTCGLYCGLSLCCWAFQLSSATTDPALAVTSEAPCTWCMPPAEEHNGVMWNTCLPALDYWSVLCIMSGNVLGVLRMKAANKVKLLPFEVTFWFSELDH
jgi:hypothetical protein